MVNFQSDNRYTSDVEKNKWLLSIYSSGLKPPSLKVPAQSTGAAVLPPENSDVFGEVALKTSHFQPRRTTSTTFPKHKHAGANESLRTLCG
jgi:hypothetical protein